MSPSETQRRRRTWRTVTTGAYTSSDARLWALELNSPRTGPEIRRWLWLEEAFDKEPKLRESFRLVDELMARRQPPVQTAAEVRRIEYAGSRGHRIAASKEERVGYIRRLLAQLPTTATYQGQRTRLAEELAELTRGVAA